MRKDALQNGARIDKDAHSVIRKRRSFPMRKYMSVPVSAFFDALLSICLSRPQGISNLPQNKTTVELTSFVMGLPILILRDATRLILYR
jgi:hypothetical protein